MTTSEYISFIFGFLLRLLIPIGATGLVAWLLHRMDARWQMEAFQQAARKDGLNIPLQKLNCWDVHDCSPERKASCPAYLETNIPCWEAHRRNGQLQDACQGCTFRKVKLTTAPVFS